jgi:hypothetical protein
MMYNDYIFMYSQLELQIFMEMYFKHVIDILFNFMSSFSFVLQLFYKCLVFKVDCIIRKDSSLLFEFSYLSYNSIVNQEK